MSAYHQWIAQKSVENKTVGQEKYRRHLIDMFQGKRSHKQNHTRSKRTASLVFWGGKEMRIQKENKRLA